MADKKYTADDIRALEGSEHVRMRPKLYFTECFKENSLDALVFEVLCHAFDEHLEGNCTTIAITINPTSFIVTYDAGMSLETMKYEDYTKAEAIMTRMAACSNLKKHLDIGHEFCKLGMATINAATTTTELISVSNNLKGQFTFKQGKTISSAIEENCTATSFTGITMYPDTTLFDSLTFTINGIKDRTEKIKEQFSGLKINLSFQLD